MRGSVRDGAGSGPVKETENVMIGWIIGAFVAGVLFGAVVMACCHAASGGGSRRVDE